MKKKSCDDRLKKLFGSRVKIVKYEFIPPSTIALSEDLYNEFVKLKEGKK